MCVVAAEVVCPSPQIVLSNNSAHNHAWHTRTTACSCSFYDTLSLSSINGMMGPTKVAGVNDTSYDAKDESDNTDDDDTDS